MIKRSYFTQASCFLNGVIAMYLYGLCAVTSCHALDEVALRQSVENLLFDLTNHQKINAGTTRQLRNHTALSQIYNRNGFTFLWSGSPEAKQRLNDLIDAIRQSELHGLHPTYYHITELESVNTDDVQRELLASDAFISQSQHRLNGVVPPINTDSNWYLGKTTIDPVDLLFHAVENNIGLALDAMWPTHPEYHLLLAKKQSLMNTHSTRSVFVPPGPLLKKGVNSERVAVLKERLRGPGQYTDYFDDELDRLVKEFQLSAGLNNDGVVGKDTLDELNSTTFSWLERLDANLERWRWLPHHNWSTYLRINIASFQLRGFSDGAQTLSMPVIVGTQARQTPVFTESMKYLVVNPYWTVPFSIATKDKLPKLKSDATGQALLGYEAKATGMSEFTSVDQFDWRDVRPNTFHYTLRQKPGKKNALGKIKFMLPNEHAIYLHDTPDRNLFEFQERNFSSGCIRVADPLGLSRWVLSHTNQLDTLPLLENMWLSEETHTINLKKHLPVLIVYFTAFADMNNDVVFRRDVYQRDVQINEKLKEYRSE